MVLTTLLPTPGSDVGADTVLIPTHLKPGPLPHPPISSQTDALLVALCRQRSDLAPDTPQACPGQGDMPRPRGDGEHLAGSPGTSSPTSAWHGPAPTTTKDPVCPIPMPGSMTQGNGGSRCRPREEEPSDQRVPQSYTWQLLPWGVQSPRSCLLPLQLFLQLGTP